MSSVGSIVFIAVVCLGLSSCDRYELVDAPTNLAFGRFQATASPTEARLVGRSASCPAFQPFLWTHRVELRETGGVGVTLVGWQMSEVSGNSLFNQQRLDVATLNQCGPMTNGRIAANGTVCGDVNFCASAVTSGRGLEHRFSSVDDNGVPNAAVLLVPLAIQ